MSKYAFTVSTERWTRSYKSLHSAEVAVGRAISGSGTQDTATITGPGVEMVCVSTGAGWVRVEDVATYLASRRRIAQARKAKGAA